MGINTSSFLTVLLVGTTIASTANATAPTCRDLFASDRALTQRHAPAPFDTAAQQYRLNRVEEILRRGDDVLPDARLAFIPGKQFVFSPSGESFVMFEASGGSLVAMLGPIGRAGDRIHAIRAFERHARRVGRRPVFYSVPEGMKAELRDAGYRFEKIGENAMLDLSTFNLAGSARSKLRSTFNKIQRMDNMQFTIEQNIGRDSELMNELQRISDTSTGGAPEKTFSMGAFDRDVLSHSPVGVLRMNGQPIAFVSMWLAPQRTGGVTVDLFRFNPTVADIPRDAMAYAIAESAFWAQRQGFQTFDLGMAPLSGLMPVESAGSNSRPSLTARAAQLIFAHGRRFYNFQGIRDFKEKFAPRWESRYVAGRNPALMPAAVIDAALATNSAPRQAPR